MIDWDVFQKYNVQVTLKLTPDKLLKSKVGGSRLVIVSQTMSIIATKCHLGFRYPISLLVVDKVVSDKSNQGGVWFREMWPLRNIQPPSCS